MKHTLKIILPIILILAIVIGACWFFLIARRDVTESIFVYWGEHFYEAGRCGMETARLSTKTGMRTRINGVH